MGASKLTPNLHADFIGVKQRSPVRVITSVFIDF